MKQFILIADVLHGQTKGEFKRVLVQQCNTLFWRLPTGYTDEIQPIHAGYGRLLRCTWARPSTSAYWTLTMWS